MNDPVTDYWRRRARIARHADKPVTVTHLERNQIRSLPPVAGQFPYSLNPDGNETVFGVELKTREPQPWPDRESL